MTQTGKKGFRGVWPIVKQVIYGAAAESVPKLRSRGQTTPIPNANSYTNYEGMKPEAYRWFRQDELVRRCIIVNAAYSTMTAGFETELEPLEKLEDEAAELAFQEKYKFVKDYVDAANRTVNLDKCLFVAQVKRSIFGKSGFEIEYAADGSPSWLLSVDSRRVTPDIDPNWKLVGYKYDEEAKWKLDENRFLYFANLDLENDCEGLSEVEPIYLVCHARHNLLRRDLPEITRSLWAPYAVLSADTSGMTAAAEDAFLDGLIEAAKSGKSLAVNKQVSATIVDINVNLAGLVALLEKLEESIIRNFGTPRFLVNKPNENRATAYTEFEAYVGGTLGNIQRSFKRELEAQWYPHLVQLALKKNGESGVVPLKVTHLWRTVRSTDVLEMSAAISSLYSNGLGIIAEEPEIAYDMMGWPKDKLRERKQEEQQKQDQQQNKPQQPGNPMHQMSPQPNSNPSTQNPTPGMPGEKTVDAPAKA
jgi:hypothetical protein